MRLKQVLGFLIVSSLLCGSVLAQSPVAVDSKADQKQAKQELEKKAAELLEQVLKETPSLRLPENRIRVQATAADLLWKRNEKRARDLFRQAVDGFAALNSLEDDDASSEASAEDLSGLQRGRNTMTVQARQVLRQEIMRLLAKHDARMARDFLHRTSTPGATRPGGRGEWNPDQETELQLAQQVASSDSKQAMQVAEESLQKGFPYGVVGVLAELQKSDKDAAAKLSGEIMQKLRGANLSTDQQAAGWAVSLMGPLLRDSDDAEDEHETAGESAKVEPLFDDKSMRELMGMLVSAALNQQPKSKKEDDDDEDSDGDESYLLMLLGRSMSAVEKYAPSRVAALKAKLADFDKALSPKERAYRDYQKMLQNGSDSKTTLEAAEKAPPELRPQIALQAAYKAAMEGDSARAREIVNEHVTDPTQRKMMLTQIERAAVQNAAQKSKLDEVRPMLMRLPVVERVAMLIQFAEAAESRKERKQALEILDEARALLPAQANNFMELQTLLQIARASATIDPPRSFDILESVVEQLNPLLSALATLEGFEYIQSFKDSEVLSGASSSMVLNSAFDCVRNLSNLSGTDFLRAQAAADRFSRADLRIMARLSVVEGILSDRGPGTSPQVSFRTAYVPYR